MSAPTTRLFVGNLPQSINEIELRTAFSAYGEITALDIKNKPTVENDKKLFAFITLTASNYDVESCIQNFANKDFNGNRLYVTRARESFLERLQREREQAQRKEIEKNTPVDTNFIPKPLNINLNSHKRKIDTGNGLHENGFDKKPTKIPQKDHHNNNSELKIGDTTYIPTKTSAVYEPKSFRKDDTKQDSDKKRLESMKKKRQEFNERKKIIKTGLIGIDNKAPNKKVIFSDDEDKETQENGVPIMHKEYNVENKKKKLFEDDENSDNEVNFGIKKQFEGKKGQQVLDLQSRYKADKRFVLDERFIEDDKSDEEHNQYEEKDEDVEVGQADEKYKQLNILQDVLGVPINIKQTQDRAKQTKSKLGMLRFDPTQPDHTKFLAPLVEKTGQSEKKRKKTSKVEEEAFQEELKEIPKVEVSKEQFYKVSDTLKEALEQQNTFSLRSLFTQETETDVIEEVPESEHNQLQKVKGKKVRNPLDPGEKNPFVYDSSDSDNEEEVKVQKEVAPQISDSKPVWREKLFFSETDERLKDGLLFFTQTNEEQPHKYRRELKTVMKKRVYNKERKNQMFQKKIGGRRKTVKKSFRKKS